MAARTRRPVPPIGGAGARNHLRLVDTGTGHPDGADAAAVHELALQLLTSRARTRQQLVAALTRRGVAADVAGAAAERLGAAGLLDDAAFAEQWVASRGAQRGRQGLACELLARGVPPATVQASVAAHDPAAEESAARALIAKRLPAMAGLPQQVRARRLAGQLARRGFAQSLVLRLVRELTAEPPGLGEPME